MFVIADLAGQRPECGDGVLLAPARGTGHGYWRSWYCAEAPAVQAWGTMLQADPASPRTMQAPATPKPSSDYRTCIACGACVHRADAHKNRYGQHICKRCRSDGVRAVGRRRLQHLVRRMPVALLAFLAVMVALVLVPLAFVLLVQLHSYSNGGMVGDLKDMLRSINRMAR